VSARSLPAVASHAIGFAEPRPGVHSPGFGACEEGRAGIAILNATASRDPWVTNRRHLALRVACLTGVGSLLGAHRLNAPSTPNSDYVHVSD
jgi:hypothetical protein